MRQAVALLAGIICIAAAGTSWAQANKHGTFYPLSFRVPDEHEVEDPDKLFIEVRPEYRVRAVHIEPLDLNGVQVPHITWTEQRFRFEATFAKPGVGGIFMQSDILDGVLFGDNGRYGVEPRVSSGLSIASKSPNLAGWEIGLVDGGNALSPSDYGAVLRAIEPIRFNFLYGEVLFPFGILRIGRQPVTESGNVGVNDGRSHRNRWGVSQYHQAADRILFGTKISELFRMVSEGDGYIPDTSLDNGAILGLAYDLRVADDLTDPSDDLQTFAVQLGYRISDPAILGPLWRDINVSAALVHAWNPKYDTKAFVIPVQLSFGIERFDFSAELTLQTGQTREMSEGLAELSGQDPVDQDILAYGTRVTLDYAIEQATFTLQWAYSTGDSDPRSTTPHTAFSWPRDTNLGLLLFEHVIAFQSARAAAVGIEVLKDQAAENFPLTEIATEGRVTNVNALFPQVSWRPIKGLALKAGVLMAWSAAPVIDPVASSLGWDGQEISDDLVNYAGGPPARYWGTEFDIGISYHFKSFFGVTVESGLLLPGPALRDANGDAANSWMTEARFVFSI